MMIKPKDIVIVSAKRTPCGSFLGQFADLKAPELAAIAHRAAIEAAHMDPSSIDEVITGCVLQAGIGQAPARQAALLAGLPNSIGATTINKMCGSGMKAVMLAHDLIRAGAARIILASGMENMSQAPYLLARARRGYRLGHGECLDHLQLDGLEDAYHKRQLMGYFADQTAETLKITRETQDAYAAQSMQRALDAQAKELFLKEITPVTLQTKTGEITVHQDEGPDAQKLQKLARLRPAFTESGTVTAGNSSSISDGAASLILMTAEEAKSRQIQPLARVVGHSTHAQDPAWFTTAPIAAVQSLLAKTGWLLQDVDLFEINEAFAVVAIATMQALNLNRDIVNINGGACALGHPIGASGARIIVTLLHALQQQQKTKGIATLCIGGGEATAIALERIRE